MRTTTPPWKRAALLALLLAGAHAPPVTGSRAPDAPIDPDYPEQNCAVNTTVDCRPAGSP